MKRRILIAAMLLAVVMLFAITGKAQAAGAVGLDKTKVVLEVGTTDKLEVMNTTAKVKWSSSNKSVVKVKNGRLTPVKVGSAKITAKVSGKKYTCKVTVADFAGMSNEQKEVIGYALQFVGNRYCYGGSSLTNGTDCSGFTMSVYKKFGYKLTHNAYAQMKETKKVNLKKIKPGDLIFYGGSKGSCNHVALYIGNKKVVHASTESTGIVVSDYLYRNYVGVGRVLKKETYDTPEEEEQEQPSTEDNITKYAKTK